MFQPAGVKTLLRIRSSEPARPSTAKTRIVVDELPRPLTAPPVASSFAIRSQDSRGMTEDAEAADEEEAENEDLLADVSTTLYNLRHGWVEERREEVAALWQQLRSEKEAVLQESEELGELEDVEKVRAMDARAKHSKASDSAEAEEMLLLLDGFRRALDQSGDLEKSLEAASEAEEQRRVQVEARLDALVPGRLSDGSQQAFCAGPADAAAGPGSGFIDAEEAAAAAVYEQASLELQAARARRVQLEKRVIPKPLDEDSLLPEEPRLRELRREVERLQMRAAWAEQSEAEATAGPAKIHLLSKGASAASSASPCRRRVASGSADWAAGTPSNRSCHSDDRSSRSPGVVSPSGAVPEFSSLDRWVDDLRLLLDESREFLPSDPAHCAVKSRTLTATATSSDFFSSSGGGPEAAAGAETPQSPLCEKHSIKHALSLSSPAQAGGSASSPCRRSGLSGLSPPSHWKTSATSAKRQSAMGEAEAAAGRRSPKRNVRGSESADDARVEDHLDEMLRELDEIDRIHCKIQNLSSWP